MGTFDEAVSIAIDAETIAGTLVTPGTLLPGVLFVHGWGGSQQQYLARASEIAALGCICLTFDLRGHAQTHRQFETVSRAANLADVLAAYDLLARRRHVDTTSIAVIGSSYGGYLAAILTGLRRVKWLALRAPALYLDANWDLPKMQLHTTQDLRGYRRNFVEATGNRALHACEAFEGDVLLVESEHDDIVPPAVLTSYRKALHRTRSLTYRCIDGADHGLTGASDQGSYTKLLVHWLSEMLGGERASKAVAQKAPGEAVTTPETTPDAASLRA
jgi:pimeloyl-ACP methyl ester carboxylesterase